MTLFVFSARHSPLHWAFMKLTSRILLLSAFCLLPLAFLQARADALSDTLHDGFTYRNLGPFRAGSWIADIAVPASPLKDHLYTFYVAARNGGVWKTTNCGTTFQPIFDSQDFLSIGSVAVAPTDANIVWVGSGDASCTRSALRGDGIYKSTDAGQSWQHLGLEETHHIARIVIHPSNPDIVYVAAMGHLFSPNEERGVFKTTDGGRTWKKILYLDDRTGAIDLVMSGQQPDTLYAAMYECQRSPGQLYDGGTNSGVFKTTDGGVTWQRLGGGFPSGTIGRIGLALYQKNPGILYAIVDNHNSTGSSATNRLIGGEMYCSRDAGATWARTSPAGTDLSRKSGYAFNQARINPANPDEVFITGETLSRSSDGGKSWTALTETQASRPFRRAFGDFRTLWIDPDNPDRMIAGSDGGVFLSYDAGRTCDHLDNLPLGEVYALTVDMETPYNIYAGLQDHESWRGPSDGWSGSISIEDWSTVGTGDGMYNQVDPADNRWEYNSHEFGGEIRYDQKLRVAKSIVPTRPAGKPFLRFNWVTPLRISPQDPKTIYTGAQVLFRSRDRGDHWEEISPDLTCNDATKISPPRGTIQFCTITTIAESPAQAGVIWVGTDDGKVQMTRNAGKNWTDATAAIAAAGGPVDAWVTRVCPSPSIPGTAYVAKSRHHQDDFRPFLYKTTDFGATWRAITNNLPARPVNVVFEDHTDSNLLFAGTDCGVYVSLDGGGRWNELRGNMPSAVVNDLLIHPRDGDLIVGTFGRGIWVTDITPLRELTPDVLDQDAWLFGIHPQPRRNDNAQGNYHLYGDRHVVTPNGPPGTEVWYYLRQNSADPVSLTLMDGKGKTVRTFRGATRQGFHNLSLMAGPGGRGGNAGGGRRGGAEAAPEIEPGKYTVTLHLGDKTWSKKVVLTGRDLNFPSSAPDADDDDDN
jgi:photosystem II stability/assembly factor-like uncharacterized protein